MIPTSLIEEWMFSTIRINTTDEKGENWVSTGFIFGYPVSKEQSIPFLVTNRHVIENQISIELHLIKEKDGKPDLDNTITLPITDLENHWHFHPNPKMDVAIMPFGRIVRHIEKGGSQIFFKLVSGSLIPSLDEYHEMDAMEEILFIGYPSGLYDQKNNTPIIRKGSTATPIYLNYNGDPKYLIDATVFPGSSGSPVFIIDNNIHWGKADRMPKDSRILFVGIVSNNITFDNEGTMITQEKPVKSQKIPLIFENFHLGIVFKPEMIKETIEDYSKVKGFKLEI